MDEAQIGNARNQPKQPKQQAAWIGSVEGKGKVRLDEDEQDKAIDCKVGWGWGWIV